MRLAGPARGHALDLHANVYRRDRHRDNTEQAPTGRSAGRLAWAGLANTYFWIDRTKRVAGVFLPQVLTFYDHTAIDLFGRFETEVYLAI